MRARLFRSTSFRLVLVYMMVFGVSVLVLLGVIYWNTAGYMTRQADAAIEAEIDLLAERYQTRGLSGLTALIRERVPGYPDRSNLYLLADPARRPLAGNLKRWPRVPKGPGGWVEFKVEQAGGGEEQRQARARTFRLREGLWLLVGRDMHQLIQVRSLMWEAFAWAAGLTLLLALLGGYMLSRTVARRLDVINAASREIMSGDLGRRIPARGSEDEFDDLVANLNAMLDRIEALMDDVRRVSDNIAHDLKTPLTRLRNELESARDTASDPTAMDRALQDADNLLATFNALLRIARIEAGHRRAGFSEVDLAVVTRDVADLYQPLAEERGLGFEVDITDGVRVIGDRDLLFQAFANLVDNAVKYCGGEGRVTITLDAGAGRARLRVSDSGPGIPETARVRVFERFYRGEQARRAPGSGLGLALVKAVVELHDARLDLMDNEPGLRVQLSMALSTSPGDSC